jgi:hypothetical protein
MKAFLLDFADSPLASLAVSIALVIACVALVVLIPLGATV